MSAEPPWTPPVLLDLPINAELFTALADNPQTHSDLAEELITALPELGLAWWCPNPREFAYVLAYTPKGVVVALALGMQSILLRVPSEQGLEPAPHFGPSWSRLTMFTGRDPLDHQRARLRHLLARAAASAPS